MSICPKKTPNPALPPIAVALTSEALSPGYSFSGFSAVMRPLSRPPWGYFDFRMSGEGFDAGYQSVPVNWDVTSERKRGLFKLLAEITGAK